MTPNWLKNKIAARYTDTSPTETDQSAAASTDITIIVAKYAQSGTVPGQQIPPLTETDFTELPATLAEMFDLVRSTDRLRAELPEALRKLTTEELIRLQPDDIERILTPPAKPPATPPANPPAGDNQ